MIYQIVFMKNFIETSAVKQLLVWIDEDFFLLSITVNFMRNLKQYLTISINY